MAETMSTSSLSSLCERLRSERLIIKSEQTALQILNSKVKNEFTELNKLIWICRHERMLLHRLINSDPTVSPANCIELMMEIGWANFIEGHKVLGHHISSVSHIYRLLSQSPKAMAEFLNASESLSLNILIVDLNRAVFNVIYGSCIFASDEKLMVDLLANLISLQLLNNADPRRVLRKGSITFCRMYKFLSEELTSTKIFLSAALHEPIMFLLCQSELFLDIDPAKSPIRFPAVERLRRFGKDENSPEYREKVAEHRKVIVEKLVTIGEKFLKGIQQALFCFPLSLTWLVRQLHTGLIERKHVTKDEAVLICTDLLFTCFICPAIINPEPLGIISDTPISHVARFNLMQVGQVLQTLALLPYERPPSHMDDLLCRFDQKCMAQVVQSILTSNFTSLDMAFPHAVADADGVEVFCRAMATGSLREINAIQLYLKSSAVDDIADFSVRKALKNCLKKMPSEFLSNTEPAGLHTDLSVMKNALNKAPIRSNSSGKLRNLADKVQNAAYKGQQRFKQTSTHNRLTQSTSVNVLGGAGIETNGTDSFSTRNPVEVFFIPLVEQGSPIGMISEEVVMQKFTRFYTKKQKKTEIEKRTRFVPEAESVVSDRITDVASDEEEDGVITDGVTGGESSCSSNDNIADEEEEEECDDADNDAEEDISTLPDNFSDVVPISANVSARGSPSLSGDRNSGRDTPFSGNAAEQNEVTGASSTVPGAASTVFENSARALSTIPVSVRRQNPEGIEEKFGKFSLPPQDPGVKYGDETYSLVSDSWSTDVVASDNEGFGEFRMDASSSGYSATGGGQFQTSNVMNQLSAVPQQQQLPPLPVLPQLSLAPSNPFFGVVGNGVLNRNNNVRSSMSSTTASTFAQAQQSSRNPSRLDYPSTNVESQDEQPFYDPSNLSQCRAFIDAKRKLRLVLSSASLTPMFNYGNVLSEGREASVPINIPMNIASSSVGQPLSAQHHLSADVMTQKQLPTTVSGSTVCLRPSIHHIYGEGDSEVRRLNEYLHVLLAEAINGRERVQCAQIREVQRCLTVFDDKGIRKLLKAMKEEHRKRTYYLLYLQQSKLTLLQLEYYLSITKNRIQREQSLTAECMIEILVRFNLEKKDMFLREFIYDFQHLNAQDEKTDAVEKALSILNDRLTVEPMWRFATPENLDYARKSMERALISHIYSLAHYPNGDADHCRDEVFFKSMQRLSLLTVTHPDLDIPKKYHGECPWPSAQAEIAIINAYKSPRDKVSCIVRCCETIENLVALSSNRDNTSSADDMLPILVYVILQARPPALLSNIQYIKDFYASQLEGKEAYCWCQFTSAVEFIKQLLTKC